MDDAPTAPVSRPRDETSAILGQLAAYAGTPAWGFKHPRTLWLIEWQMNLFSQAKLIAPVPASLLRRDLSG